jgi:hypothetical protein
VRRRGIKAVSDPLLGLETAGLPVAQWCLSGLDGSVISGPEMTHPSGKLDNPTAPSLAADLKDPLSLRRSRIAEGL